jgi:hypothetical protein
MNRFLSCLGFLCLAVSTTVIAQTPSPSGGEAASKAAFEQAALISHTYTVHFVRLKDDPNLPVLPPDETFILRYGQIHVIERFSGDKKASVRVVLGQNLQLMVTGDYTDSTNRVLHPDPRDLRVLTGYQAGTMRVASRHAEGIMKYPGEAVMKLGPTMEVHVTTDTDPDIMWAARYAQAARP